MLIGAILVVGYYQSIFISLSKKVQNLIAITCAESIGVLALFTCIYHG